MTYRTDLTLILAFTQHTKKLRKKDPLKKSQKCQSSFKLLLPYCTYFCIPKAKYL